MINDINEITKQKIWDEVMKSNNIRTELMPHERTKAMLQREYSLGRGQIEAIIKSLMDKGILTSRPALDNGKACTAYSFVSGGEFDINP